MATMTIEQKPLLLTAPTTPEAAPKVPGRLPLMAFVDADTEKLLQESLVLLGRCVIMRGGIAKAIEHLSHQRSPQLLIVDISGVDMPLSKVQMLADVCEPGTTVVALGNVNDVGLYRDLTEAGVSSYIVKPINRELLARVLEPKTAVSTGNSLKLGKIAAFIGARGGVGTTTLAANLAWHLANRQGRRVALVDLDLQNGDAGLLFNIQTTPGFRDALTNPLRIDNVLLERIMTQIGDRLFVVSSEEPLDATIPINPTAIDTLFSVLRSQFHYVVVDVPRTPAPAYRRALEVADRRIIVVDQTMRSMRDSVRVAKLFDDGIEFDPRNLFVVNRVGESGPDSLSLKDIEVVLRIRPATLIPFLPKVVVPAANYASVAASGHGKFAHAIATLAFELCGRPQRQPWWTKLMGSARAPRLQLAPPRGA